MTPSLSVAQVRDLDRRTIDEVGIPGRVLMEVAGYGAFTVARQVRELEKLPGAIVVIAGKGNNAGDGFVLARFCGASGVPVRVLTIEDPVSLVGDARTNFDLLAPFGIEVQRVALSALESELARSGLAVDAMLGTGIRSAVRSPFREVIEAINDSRTPVLSLDLPSGLCGDTGEVLGTAIRASWTVTFGAVKHGLRAGAGPAHAGVLHVVPLPFAPRLWQEIGVPLPAEG